MTEDIANRARSAGCVFNEVMPAFSVSARALWGESPCHRWSRLFGVREIRIPDSDPGTNSTIVLAGAQASLTHTMLDIRQWGLYVEAHFSRLESQAVTLDWIFRNGENGEPIVGTFTPTGTGLWYMSVPPGPPENGTSSLHLRIAGTEPDPARQVVHFHQMTILPFRP